MVTNTEKSVNRGQLMDDTKIVEEEWLDLVDENDQVIGEVKRSDIYKKDLVKQVRAVWLLISNDDGKLWIPRRHHDKAVLPNALDGSAVGCVARGETYEQALHREVMEELNIDMQEQEYRLLGKFSPKLNKTWCMVHVYAMTSNEVPPYDPTEFTEHFWLRSRNSIYSGE